MSLPLWFSTHPLVHAVGLALLHGLWQGAAIAGVAALLLRSTDPAAAARRHAVLLGALLAQLALFALTVALVHDGRIVESVSLTEPVAATAGEASARGGGSALAGPVGAAYGGIRPLLPWLVAVWAGVAAFFAARLVVAVASAARLREAAAPARPAVEARARRLAERIGLRRLFRVRETAAVDTPAAVGWLRPAVLLPGSVVDRLDGPGLDALLLHELAHLKARDDATTALEAAARAALFHHPSTWWLSRRAAAEREHRCDDLVAASTGDRARYVRALLDVEERRASPAWSALHSATGSLLERVHRMVDPPARPSPRLRLAGGVAALAVAVGTLLGLGLVVPAVPATPPGWTTIRAVDDAGPFTVAFEAGRVSGIALDGEPLSPDRFTHRRDSLYVLDSAGSPRFALQVRPEGGLEWRSRSPDWRLEGSGQSSARPLTRTNRFV